MIKFLKVLSFILPLSFLVGTWWGLRGIERRISGKHRQGVELKLLYRRGAIPPQIISDFTSKTGIQISGFPMESDFALWEELNERPAHYDLIQLFSPMAKELIRQKRLEHLNFNLLRNINKVSFEFSHLDYDPQFQYFLPLTWGLNGFLWKQKKLGPPPNNLQKIFEWPQFSGHVFLLAQETELFFLMEKMGLISREWLDQEKWEEFHNTVQKLKNFIKISPLKPIDLWQQDDTWVMQVPHGLAAKILSQFPSNDNNKYTYWLPEDSVSLWVSLIGITKSSSFKIEAHEFLAYLLESTTIKKWSHLGGMPQQLNPAKQLPYLQCNPPHT